LAKDRFSPGKNGAKKRRAFFFSCLFEYPRAHRKAVGEHPRDVIYRSGEIKEDPT
jgi:hypothetical protein